MGTEGKRLNVLLTFELIRIATLYPQHWHRGGILKVVLPDTISRSLVQFHYRSVIKSALYLVAECLISSTLWDPDGNAVIYRPDPLTGSLTNHLPGVIAPHRKSSISLFRHFEDISISPYTIRFVNIFRCLIINSSIVKSVY